MARKVIKQIRLHGISPHLFLLYVEWQNGIAACADLALVWRGVGPKSTQEGTREEDERMRQLYASGAPVKIIPTLPEWAWDKSPPRAQVLLIRRARPHP